MSKFSVILKINLINKSQALKNIKNMYSKSEIKQFQENDDDSTYLFKIITSDASEMIKYNLNKIADVTVISVVSDLGIISKLPKFSTWLIVGLIVGLLIVSYIAFSSTDNFIDMLTPSQLLVIQIIIALVISIRIFLYDRKTQQEIINVLSTLDLRTSEINENVKDLSKF